MAAPFAPSRTSLRSHQSVSWCLTVAMALALSSTFAGLAGGASARPSARADATVPGVTTDQNLNYTPGWTNVTNFIDDDDLEPSATQQAGVTFDPPLQSAVIFGGMDSDGAVLNQTWLFLSGENEWFGLGMHAGNGNASGPPPLLHPGMAFDTVDGYLVMYGGELANGSPYGGMWAFGGNAWANLSWTNLTPDLSVTPGPVSSPSMTYDSADGAVFLYTGAAHGSTWEYRDKNWHEITTISTPPARTGQTVSYDPMALGVVMFGGFAWNSSTPLHDTWMYTSGNWTPTATGIAPPDGPSPALAYDPVLSELFLLEGGPTVQVWTWAGGLWANATVSGGLAPSGRTGFVATFENGPFQFILLFGGATWHGWPPVLNDVWGWDYPTIESFSGLTASGPTPYTWGAIALTAAIPVAVVLIWTRWPRRPSPATLPGSVPRPTVPGVPSRVGDSE